MTESWDQKFLAVAAHYATWSKDPTRSVGCVIVDENKIQLAGGFNGFPRGIADDDRLKDKLIKQQIIVHAEVNAIAAAARKGHALEGGILYSTLRPCPSCATMIIQAGIKRVVTPAGIDERSKRDGCEFGEKLLLEAGVKVLKI